MECKNQRGRSMIEMLGVLAIIGVLSVAGIAGYAKAMIKWKINKTVEMVEQITYNILTLYTNQKTLGFTNSVSSVAELKNLGIIPENLAPYSNDTYHFVNPLGGISYIYLNNTLFEIYISDISKEACIALSTFHWDFNSPYFVGLAAVNRTGNNPVASYCMNIIDATEGRYFSDEHLFACKCARTTTPEFGLPVPPDIAAQACSCKSDVCEFTIAHSLTGIEDPETCGKDFDWD
ncbi:MAG: type II secretion system protein [Pseudomonadota bacterium]|nr:type II secretion system protein [Pseudomonadota bacterium]